MFGIGASEMIMILAIALVVIGPKKLPDLAKALGRARGEFKKATRDFKESLEVNDDFKELKEVKKAFDDINKDIREAGNIPETPVEKAKTKPPQDIAEIRSENTTAETEEAPKDGQGIK